MTDHKKTDYKAPEMEWIRIPSDIITESNQTLRRSETKRIYENWEEE